MIFVLYKCGVSMFLDYEGPASCDICVIDASIRRFDPLLLVYCSCYSSLAFC